MLGCFGPITWTSIPSFSIEIVRQEIFANAAGQDCTVTPIKIGLTKIETLKEINHTADLYAQIKGEMKVIQFPSRASVQPFACPISVSLWLEYRKRNPDGLKAPPVDLRECTDLELMSYLVHVDTCDDCNEV